MPNSIDKAIGVRIRKHRARLTLTVEQLAKMIGVSEQEMLDFEEGSERVEASLLYKVATALGVSTASLLNDEDPSGMVK